MSSEHSGEMPPSEFKDAFEMQFGVEGRGLTRLERAHDWMMRVSVDSVIDEQVATGGSQDEIRWHKRRFNESDTGHNLSEDDSEQFLEGLRALDGMITSILSEDKRVILKNRVIAQLWAQHEKDAKYWHRRPSALDDYVFPFEEDRLVVQLADLHEKAQRKAELSAMVDGKDFSRKFEELIREQFLFMWSTYTDRVLGD